MYVCLYVCRPLPTERTSPAKKALQKEKRTSRHNKAIAEVQCGPLTHTHTHTHTHTATLKCFIANTFSVFCH